MSVRKTLFICCAIAVIGIAGFFLYVNLAFPKVRCEAVKHLDAPEKIADCMACHVKTTAVVAQHWKDSKHGVLLVKCAVCHGQPDGKGSIPFTPRPDPMYICARCHDPSIKRMEAKYGERPSCNSCHPHHQNPMHGNAFIHRAPSDKTSLE